MILNIINVSKSFGGLKAIDEVGFSIEQGEILGLIGPNGAGKTTLFNLIAGVLRPNEGVIKFLGEAIQGKKPSTICHKGIARTFQITKPFLSISTLENVMVGALFGSRRRHKISLCQQRATALLDMMGLGEKALQKASELTLVERKKLELTRALATEPTLLLLDEVIAGLNPTEVDQVVETIKNIRQTGVTILMIEHVMRAIMNLSDRIIVLHYGRKIAEGTPQEVVSDPQVIKAYLGSKSGVVT